MASVLVVGGGGRENAIAWKLSLSTQVKKIYITPYNIGAALLPQVESVDLDISNFKVLAEWCIQKCIDLVVVGPEDPLASGIADILAIHNVACFGPSAKAARIESDKEWAKQFMDDFDIPTAKWKSFTDVKQATEYVYSADFPALVVKASGLAAGKGVVVASNKQEACLALDAILTENRFGKAGQTVVVEELLVGEEVSVLCFTDGTNINVMLPSQDYKRAYNQDKGPNTGGMGAFCPCFNMSQEELNEAKNILQRAVDGLQKRGMPFVGVLYAGLMVTNDGIRVLEFNCRFGDPETQTILPLLETDLYEIMKSCVNGTLNKVKVEWKSDQFCVGVMMASRGYPLTSSKGDVISGLSSVTKGMVFHSGTKLNNYGELVTNGGRVLIVVTMDQELVLAAARATMACGRIMFNGAHFRTDIAHRGIARAILAKGVTTYKSSGVDIEAGNDLVPIYKDLVSVTKRQGVLGELGSFGGMFDLKAAAFRDPILVSSSDGVGTKLKIALVCNSHKAIGQDLVAMCVNDIVVHGAEPLFFLDYFATGRLEGGNVIEVIKGIADGCRQAGCALIGGETAEMPGIYHTNDYDVAGFAVGAVEREKILPKINDIVSGDIVIGLESSGPHANGFSLIRKIMERGCHNYSDEAPFSLDKKTFGEEFLTPTNIYVERVLPAIRNDHIKALAHITGGGLLENIPRILPENKKVVLDATKWEIKPVFGWIAATGSINEIEMLRTMNCGLGMILIVAKEFVDDVLVHTNGKIVGVIEDKSKDDCPVVVTKFANAMEPIMRPHIQTYVASRMHPKMRVAVLISGSGTNLQALIDATTDDPSMMSEVVLVISNKPDVEGLERAKKAGILALEINHTNYKTREEFESVMMKALEQTQIDVVCLAGFMRVLTKHFVNKWRGRLLNIHPSLLPLFKGLDAQKQALQSGVRVAGCTVHFVEEEIDAGAIIVQEAVTISIDETVESLIEKIKSVEHIAYPKALKLFATNQVYLDKDIGKTKWLTNSSDVYRNIV
ncbi:trifunctional purine biosynthetic protein adenosine-3 [Daktulosphaira vitifoliae]|uniref:trifunctional purine biosynthetic protein adenosine-3 n=1 Tax=Daktulosphaira vitifoliae TaxID=58002 RepID=UPI0021AA5F80|nr:trifunctional purine biosynthetic protein adenosine-3 [Daktulosphaira vitifoliae]XP_050545153.1 trifunctional purine biosynthetic protein adenosine-3 [Daktulosphaira vitifoliae]